MSAFEKRDIFPPVDEHTHGSTLVETPGGDILAAWFQGSGERWADDVRIMGARLSKRADEWSEPFLMADVPGFPDVNPILFLDPRERLWLMWYTVIANQWDTSLLRVRISEDFEGDGPPKWIWQDTIFVKPGDLAERGIQPGDRFVESVKRQVASYTRYLANDLRADDALLSRWSEWSARMIRDARGDGMRRRGFLYAEDGSHTTQDMGFPYFRRMGWQTKNKAVVVNGSRILIPLYSDGFDFSLMAITDDCGETWSFSEPLVGAGNIQPSIAEKSDGTLVAYMRDNGPPPKRLHVAESTDNGETWSDVRNSPLPNPGSGADVVTLRNGHWALVYNDTESGRHSLAVSISTDEGATWGGPRHLELDERGQGAAGRYSYPSVVQTADDSLQVTHSAHRNAPPGRTITWARFDEAWVSEGD